MIRAPRAVALCATSLALTLAGCTLRPPPSPPSPRDQSAAAPTTQGGAAVVYQHPFPPDRLIVHPLTRIVADPQTGDRRIEAHFELLDRYGHTVKSLGTAVLELRVSDQGIAGAAGGPRQLARWTKPMRTPDDNAAPFDRVTRTYRLTLADLPPNLPPIENLSLIVRFTDERGSLLTAERRFAR